MSQNSNREIKNAIKIVLSVIFLLALFRFPYSYYEFLRVAGTFGFIVLAFLDNYEKKLNIRNFWIGSAILLNPILRFTFDRLVWNTIDVIWAGVLIYTIFSEYEEYGAK